jgi:hypothetical protein
MPQAGKLYAVGSTTDFADCSPVPPDPSRFEVAQTGLDQLVFSMFPIDLSVENARHYLSKVATQFCIDYAFDA